MEDWDVKASFDGTLKTKGHYQQQAPRREKGCLWPRMILCDGIIREAGCHDEPASDPISRDTKLTDSKAQGPLTHTEGRKPFKAQGIQCRWFRFNICQPNTVHTTLAAEARHRIVDTLNSSLSSSDVELNGFILFESYRQDREATNILMNFDSSGDGADFFSSLAAQVPGENHGQQDDFFSQLSNQPTASTTEPQDEIPTPIVSATLPDQPDVHTPSIEAPAELMEEELDIPSIGELSLEDQPTDSQDHEETHHMPTVEEPQATIEEKQTDTKKSEVSVKELGKQNFNDHNADLFGDDGTDFMSLLGQPPKAAGVSSVLGTHMKKSASSPGFNEQSHHPVRPEPSRSSSEISSPARGLDDYFKDPGNDSSSSFFATLADRPAPQQIVSAPSSNHNTPAAERKQPTDIFSNTGGDSFFDTLGQNAAPTTAPEPVYVAPASKPTFQPPAYVPPTYVPPTYNPSSATTPPTGYNPLKPTNPPVYNPPQSRAPTTPPIVSPFPQAPKVISTPPMIPPPSQASPVAMPIRAYVPPPYIAPPLGTATPPSVQTPTLVPTPPIVSTPPMMLGTVPRSTPPVGPPISLVSPPILTPVKPAVPVGPPTSLVTPPPFVQPTTPPFHQNAQATAPPFHTNAPETPPFHQNVQATTPPVRQDPPMNVQQGHVTAAPPTQAPALQIQRTASGNIPNALTTPWAKSFPSSPVIAPPSPATPQRSPAIVPGSPKVEARAPHIAPPTKFSQSSPSLHSGLSTPPMSQVPPQVTTPPMVPPPVQQPPVQQPHVQQPHVQQPHVPPAVKQNVFTPSPPRVTPPVKQSAVFNPTQIPPQVKQAVFTPPVPHVGPPVQQHPVFSPPQEQGNSFFDHLSTENPSFHAEEPFAEQEESQHLSSVEQVVDEMQEDQIIEPTTPPATTQEFFGEEGGPIDTYEQPAHGVQSFQEISPESETVQYPEIAHQPLSTSTQQVITPPHAHPHQPFNLSQSMPNFGQTTRGVQSNVPFVPFVPPPAPKISPVGAPANLVSFGGPTRGPMNSVSFDSGVKVATPPPFTPFNPVQQNYVPMPTTPMGNYTPAPQPYHGYADNSRAYPPQGYADVNTYPENNAYGGVQRERCDPSSRPPHPIICFGFGGKLVAMFPRKRVRLSGLAFPQAPQTDGEVVAGEIKVHNLGKVLANTEYVRGMLSFPGPLSSAKAKDVNRFLEERVASYESTHGFENNSWLQNRRVLIQMLQVIVEHHGVISGPDAEQAIKDIQKILKTDPKPFPVSRRYHNSEDEARAIAEVEALVLAGNREGAFECAVSRELWPYAMVIGSSFQNPDVMRNALTSFVQSMGQGEYVRYGPILMPPGSPLRTMSLLWVGRGQDIFNGDGSVLERWREQVATLMANKMNNKSVYGSLADKLWSQQRQVEAAHFCYILADHDFDVFDNPNSRLVLMGSDHKTRPSTFITPEAIRLSEVYEYAKSLSNTQFINSQFQVYKMIYVLWLAELGLMDQAKKYHTVIENTVSKNRGSYPYNGLFIAHMEDFKQRSSTVSTRASQNQGGLGGLIGGWFSKIVDTGPTLPPTGATSLPRNSSFPSVPTHHHPPAPMMRQSTSLDKDMDNLSQTRGSSHSLPPTLHPTLHLSHSMMDYPRDRTDPPDSSFSTKKIADPKPDPKPEPKSEKKNEANKNNKKGLRDWIPSLGLFGKGNPSGVIVADMGESNSLVYNEKYKMWLRPGEEPDPSLVASLAPPPIMPVSTPNAGPPSMTGGAPPMGMGGGVPPTGFGATPPMAGPPANAAAGSAPGRRRNKYVDTFNPEANNQPRTFAPVVAAPPMQPMKVFTPSAAFHSSHSAPDLGHLATPYGQQPQSFEPQQQQQFVPQQQQPFVPQQQQPFAPQQQQQPFAPQQQQPFAPQQQPFVPQQQQPFVPQQQHPFGQQQPFGQHQQPFPQ
ncbi:hypothetical protein PROFUN_03689 [Planoprotostelium fungivorum]|uniref:Protein transport protein sec16 n=1 Tax=Planoprotostelium fungivorum TaxID=1890364 RepID=A0A2P6NSK7_9EUKA|nr:hypothetical protein PROFUN_03689 [Planoprotostelium fungivorum]